MSNEPQNEDSPELVITSAPQFHEHTSTTSIMWFVTLCLLPAAVWGVYVFGPRAALVLLVAILSAVLIEFIIDRYIVHPRGGRSLAAAGDPADLNSANRGGFRRTSVRDGSAFLSGFLIGMSMPPQVPLFVPAVASAFAMIVVKWTFGGLGSNWMNPALAGRVFVFFSWTGAMTRWTMPKTLLAVSGTPDALSGATPLGLIKAQLVNGTVSATGPIDVLRQAGFPRTHIDVQVTDWLNTHILGYFGATLPGGYVDPFVGNVPGAIGEVSALWLLVGSIFMFGRRIISWEIPFSYFFSFAAFTWIFGGIPYHFGFFHGDVLFQVLTGGFMLALFYMATDPVTSPMSSHGMIIFGVGVGFFTFLFRTFGSFPDGVALAIIFMNIFVPLINKLTAPRRYGLGAPTTVRR